MFNARMIDEMKYIFFGVYLTLSLLNHAIAKDVTSVKVDILSKTSVSWDGKTLPDYEKGQSEISILKIIIPPGVKLPWHKHPVINAGILLKGELTVVAEDDTILNMKAGDTIVEVVGKWHYGKNEGDEPAEIIVFYAGTQGVPLTIKK